MIVLTKVPHLPTGQFFAGKYRKILLKFSAAIVVLKLQHSKIWQSTFSWEISLLTIYLSTSNFHFRNSRHIH